MWLLQLQSPLGSEWRVTAEATDWPHMLFGGPEVNTDQRHHHNLYTKYIAFLLINTIGAFIFFCRTIHLTWMFQFNSCAFSHLFPKSTRNWFKQSTKWHFILLIKCYSPSHHLSQRKQTGAKGHLCGLSAWTCTHMNPVLTAGPQRGGVWTECWLGMCAAVPFKVHGADVNCLELYLAVPVRLAAAGHMPLLNLISPSDCGSAVRWNGDSGPLFYWSVGPPSNTFDKCHLWETLLIKIPAPSPRFTALLL